MKSFRVYAPTDLLFVCGGDADVKRSKPVAFRGAFMNMAFDPTFDKFTILLAETLNPFFPKGDYQDILQLEQDVAQIAGLVVLFYESFGSAAELGAFAMMNEVSANLFVIIDSKHFNDNSFISLGPLRSLRNRHGHGVACVLPCSDLGIIDCHDITKLNMNEFRRILTTAIPERYEATKPRTTFNKSNKGHVVKFIVGLIEHFGALTFEEIEVYLSLADASDFKSDLKNMLLFAEFAEWIATEQRGLKFYYSARKLRRQAFKYNLLPNFKLKDNVRNRDRWKSDIRKYWEINEVDRFRAICAAMSL